MSSPSLRRSAPPPRSPSLSPPLSASPSLSYSASTVVATPSLTVSSSPSPPPLILPLPAPVTLSVSPRHKMDYRPVELPWQAQDYDAVPRRAQAATSTGLSISGTTAAISPRHLMRPTPNPHAYPSLSSNKNSSSSSSHFSFPPASSASLLPSSSSSTDLHSSSSHLSPNSFSSLSLPHLPPLTQGAPKLSKREQAWNRKLALELQKSEEEAERRAAKIKQMEREQQAKKDEQHRLAAFVAKQRVKQQIANEHAAKEKAERDAQQAAEAKKEEEEKQRRKEKEKLIREQMRLEAARQLAAQEAAKQKADADKAEAERARKVKEKAAASRKQKQKELLRAEAEAREAQQRIQASEAMREKLLNKDGASSTLKKPKHSDKQSLSSSAPAGAATSPREAWKKAQEVTDRLTRPRRQPKPPPVVHSPKAKKSHVDTQQLTERLTRPRRNDIVHDSPPHVTERSAYNKPKPPTSLPPLHHRSPHLSSNRRSTRRTTRSNNVNDAQSSQHEEEWRIVFALSGLPTPRAEQCIRALLACRATLLDLPDLGHAELHEMGVSQWRTRKDIMDVARHYLRHIHKQMSAFDADGKPFKYNDREDPAEAMPPVQVPHLAIFDEKIQYDATQLLPRRLAPLPIYDERGNEIDVGALCRDVARRMIADRRRMTEQEQVKKQEEVEQQKLEKQRELERKREEEQERRLEKKREQELERHRSVMASLDSPKRSLANSQQTSPRSPTQHKSPSSEVAQTEQRAAAGSQSSIVSPSRVQRTSDSTSSSPEPTRRPRLTYEDDDGVTHSLSSPNASTSSASQSALSSSKSNSTPSLQSSPTIPSSSIPLSSSSYPSSAASSSLSSPYISPKPLGMSPSLQQLVGGNKPKSSIPLYQPYQSASKPNKNNITVSKEEDDWRVDPSVASTASVHDEEINVVLAPRISVNTSSALPSPTHASAVLSPRSIRSSSIEDGDRYHDDELTVDNHSSVTLPASYGYTPKSLSLPSSYSSAGSNRNSAETTIASAPVEVNNRVFSDEGFIAGGRYDPTPSYSSPSNKHSERRVSGPLSYGNANLRSNGSGVVRSNRNSVDKSSTNQNNEKEQEKKEFSFTAEVNTVYNSQPSISPPSSAPLSPLNFDFKPENYAPISPKPPSSSYFNYPTTSVAPDPTPVPAPAPAPATTSSYATSSYASPYITSPYPSPPPPTVTVKVQPMKLSYSYMPTNFQSQPIATDSAPIVVGTQTATTIENKNKSYKFWGSYAAPSSATSSMKIEQEEKKEEPYANLTDQL